MYAKKLSTVFCELYMTYINKCLNTKSSKIHKGIYAYEKTFIYAIISMG